MKAFRTAAFVAVSMLAATPLAAYLPSADDACDSWIDANDNGKRDKNEPSLMTSHDDNAGVPTRSPDEVRTEAAGSRTTTTKIWRRAATEDDYVEESEVEEKLVEVRDGEGRLVEKNWQPVHGSDGTSKRYKFSPEGWLVEKSVEGPGNSYEETTYEHDSDGKVTKAFVKFALGGSNVAVTEIYLIDEGGIPVRAASLSYEEGPDSEGRPSVAHVDRVVTYEYDRDLRLVALREVTITPARVGMSITRFRYDCKKR